MPRSPSPDLPLSEDMDVGLDRIPGFYDDAEEQQARDLPPAGYIGALEDPPEHLQLWLPDIALPPPPPLARAPPPPLVRAPQPADARSLDKFVLDVKRAGYQRAKRSGLGRYWSKAAIPAIRRLIVEPYVRQGGSLAARTYTLDRIDANGPFVPDNAILEPRG
jgi:hypothetical protein